MSAHAMDKGPADIDEHCERLSSPVPVQSEVDLQYGKSGLRGLLDSPYVFGAAFIASMGGFSFGYGMVVQLS